MGAIGKAKISHVMRENEIEWEQKGTHEPHLSVLDYKKKVREQEVEELTEHKNLLEHLIGQNGCGKSTMIKVISGVIGVDPGSEVILDGKKSTGGLARQAMAAGVRVIYQDLSIFPNLTVAENIAFDQHVDSAVKGVNWSRMYKKAQEVLDRMKIQLDLDVLVEELSIADRQLVAIARALATNAKLLAGEVLLRDLHNDHHDNQADDA